MLKITNMANTNSLVSIIIPAYNAQEYIGETIESVLAQSYKNWELLIIDDGSIDNTKIIIEYYLSDSRIHYFFQSNIGVSVARNKGISHANGDFIAFLDSDDTWNTNNLDLKIQCLKYFNVDFVFSDANIIDDKSKIINNPIIGTDENILEQYLLWIKPVIPGPSSNLILRKECFVNLCFDPALSTAADQDFCFNLVARYRGKRVPEILINYRFLQNSMSRNIETMEKDHIAVYLKAEKNKLFSGFCFKQRCFSYLYLTLAGSWWINGGNKYKGLYFLAKSFFSYPPTIVRKIVIILGMRMLK